MANIGIHICHPFRSSGDRSIRFIEKLSTALTPLNAQTHRHWQLSTLELGNSCAIAAIYLAAMNGRDGMLSLIAGCVRIPAFSRVFFGGRAAGHLGRGMLPAVASALRNYSKDSKENHLSVAAQEEGT